MRAARSAVCRALSTVLAWTVVSTGCSGNSGPIPIECNSNEASCPRGFACGCLFGCYCEPGCASDDDCGAGKICKSGVLGPPGECVAGCRTDDDCPANFHCPFCLIFCD